MLIVALSGKMYSGKTTVANHLVNNFEFERMGFAQQLKEDLSDMGFPGKAIVEKPDWMRKLMQVYGQAKRAVYPDHWSDALVQKLIFAGDKVVIDDLRFPNEIDALQKFAEDFHADLKLFRVERIYSTPTIASLHKDILGHQDISETALDDRGGAEWYGLLIARSGESDLLCEQIETYLGLKTEV